MKIASRGFYFYIEIFIAVLAVVILLFAVKENPESKAKEFVYYDMSSQVKSSLLQTGMDEGVLVLADPTEFKMKAAEFEVTNKDTGTVESYVFDKETYKIETYKVYDKESSVLAKTIYLTDSEDELIRLAYQEKKVAATITVNDSGESSYRYYNQGYESDRYENLLYVIHNENPDAIQAMYEQQEVTKLGESTLLNNRESIVPLLVVLMGALMGFFIVIAFIFLDMDEGVIRAFAVTPSSVWKYLLTKIMVVMTTVLISSSIIVIPIMGTQPNYPLFYVYLLILSFAFSALGLFIASFFDSISKAFGALYMFIIAMIVPVFSYYVPGFDPLWLRFFPTYPAIQGMKEIMLVNTDASYVLMYSGVFLAGGFVLFMLANQRFKKSLTA